MILCPDRIIFGDSSQAPETGAVRVEQGLISAIGTREALVAAYPGEEQIEHPGCTLLPGLIDMHVHIGIDGSPDAPAWNDYMWALCAAGRLQQAFGAGVTTVRDVGSRDGLAVTLRDAAKRNYVCVPRILTCNEGICMTGGHGHDMNGLARECDGEWEIRQAIRRNFREGADWIKILDSEGLRGQEYTQQELDAAVDECHRMGKLCAAHAGYQPSDAMCVKAGFDTIEHGTYLTVEEARAMAKNGQTWIPTIIAFMYIEEQLRAGGHYKDQTTEDYFHQVATVYEKNFKNLYDTGVRVACGTDQVMYGAHLYPVAKEAAYMVRYGITPLQAIEAATKNGADALRLGDKLGQIKAGYLADFLVAEGNPAENIEDLEAVRVVYQEGRPVYSSK